MKDNLLYNSNSNIGTEGGGEVREKGAKYSRRPYAHWILRTRPVLLPLHIWLGFSKHFSVSFSLLNRHRSFE